MSELESFFLVRMADGFLDHVGNREALLAGKNVGDRDTIYFFTDIYNEKENALISVNIPYCIGMLLLQ